MPITPEQCHAARTLACVDRDLLAAQAGLTANTVAAFEASGKLIDGVSADVLQHALEQLGIEFIPEDASGGAGVRLKFDREQTGQLSSWETEGGTAAEDEVP